MASCVALSILIISSSKSFAVLCPNAPDGVHHFNQHHVLHASEEHYNHQHLVYYDQNNQPVYNSCLVTIRTSSCCFTCQYCGTQRPDYPTHTHVNTYHSVESGN